LANVFVQLEGSEDLRQLIEEGADPALRNTWAGIGPAVFDAGTASLATSRMLCTKWNVSLQSQSMEDCRSFERACASCRLPTK